MADDLFIKRAFLWVLVGALFILAFLLLKPIIFPILFALLLAYIFEPVYRVINNKVKRKNLSAFLLILGIIVVIAVPVFYMAPTLVRQTFDTYQLVQNYDFSEFISKASFLQGDIARLISNNIDNLVSKTFSTLLNQFTDMLINLPSLLLQFAVFIFTFFFAIRDSKELGEYFSSLSPFSASTEAKFLKEFRGITNAIVFGQILIGLIQGLAVGAGLFFLGVPKALTLTFVACIVSMIPVLGSWIVWLPTGVLLLVLGQTFSGIFMLLYGALFVSTIDNVLRPYILSRRSNLPIAMSVIGTIGGLYLFGIPGLLLGPLILAYVMIIIEFYQKGKLSELFKD
jgi:predicted PurR-regulated permease PerM